MKLKKYVIEGEITVCVLVELEIGDWRKLESLSQAREKLLEAAGDILGGIDFEDDDLRLISISEVDK